MVKLILNVCNFSLFAEIALLMFFGIFVVVSIRTLLTNRQTMEANAQIALQDNSEIKGS